jgi:hypothetical protein
LGRVETTPDRARAVLDYLHEVHEFRDGALENPTPVEVVDTRGQPR